MNAMKKTIAALLGTVSAAALCSLTAFADEAAASSSQTASQEVNPTMQLLTSIIPFAIALVLLYLILLRPQQKREKEAQAMRDAVRIGDEVCTAGGIVGIVLKVEEETVVLETGAERNRIRIKKWAIHENITQIEERKQAEKERKAARSNGIAAAAANNDGKKKKKSED